MLVSLTKVLASANRDGYAVPAFNINDLEPALAVVRAAVAAKSPVILATSEGAVEYAGMDALAGIVHAIALKMPFAKKCPIVFHLDHGKNPAVVERAIKSGYYTSVMFDGSSLPYAQNVRITKKIVALAKPRGISVEAELGSIAGIEDFVSVEARDAHLTDPVQAVAFVRETGCDALAIAIGTAHGAFKFHGEPTLDIARLKKIKATVHVPLVLHGASGVNEEWIEKLHTQCKVMGDCARLEGARGVSDALVRRAVKAGINKVNVDTDLRIAFTAGVRQALLDSPKEIDPRKILAPALALMQEFAFHKMQVFGSRGRV